MARGVGDRPRHAAIGRGLTVAAVAIALVLSVAAPADATPKYPSKDKVSHARHRADQSASAAAKMRKHLAAERATLKTLDDKAEVAVEAYNGAVVELNKAKRAYASAKKQVKQSTKNVEQARKKVAAVATAAYTGSGVAAYVQLLGASSPEEAISSAGAINVLGQQQSGALAKLKAARVVQRVVRKQAATALTKQRAETKRVKAAKKHAQAEVDAQQQVISHVATLEAKLARKASGDATTAEHLASKRQAGIRAAKRAAAAAARRRAEAKRRAAAQAAKQRAREQASHHSSGHHSSRQHHHHASHHHHYGHGAHAAVRFAYAQLGKWYEWAAAGPSTYDCSGLTMRAWQHGGVSLPHWSVGQWYATRRVSLANLHRGDLVFYATNTSSPSTIHHVAIYIGGGRMIEAPHTGAQVRISSIYRPGLIGAGRP